jgi:cyclohexa-1,5-dienecarbonyl-CoA hydratase
MTAPLRVWLEEEGALLRLRLARPKANIVDAAMIAALDAALAEHLPRADLRAVLVDAEGPHFSFGASVEEHLPANCAAMLASLHALLLRMLASPVPLLFAVRGQCLGGGLEVALAGTLIFAAPDARFGQPEIRLGVFAPFASAVLPERIPRAAAEEMLLSGRSLTAEEARAIGLVTDVAEDPEAAARAWFTAHLADKSAAAVRYAVQAARLDFVARVRDRLARLERMYLDDLMSTHDAREGLDSFLARRPARWEHR